MMRVKPKKQVIVNPDTMEAIPESGITVERDSEHFFYWLKLLEWGDVEEVDESKTGGDTEAG